MPELPDDPEAAAEALAVKISAAAGTARSRAANHPDAVLDLVKAAVYLGDRPGVVLALRLLNRWVEGPQAVNGTAPIHEYREAAEAVSLATAYLKSPTVS